jgi:HlyD family secretion protein
MVKKIVLIMLAVALVGSVLFFAIDGTASKEDSFKTIAADTGDIVEKALAVGRIEPVKEVSIKSKIPGIVRRIFVEVGDVVEVGDPLFDIAPDPTPLEYAETKRQVELAQVSFDNAKLEHDRARQLKDKQLVSDQEYERAARVFEEAELRLMLAQERLSLIESGQTTIADIKIDNIIKSPFNGTVLERLVEEGDPIVPLTSYQAGTELMTLAQMDNLVFKGSVDEIDVGKLVEGMEAKIEVGALSTSKLDGQLIKISPKARREEGSTVFPVEIEINASDGAYLRAGYSANADIIISQKLGILLIPERLIQMEDSVSFVEVQDSLGTVERREIKTGLSDGLNVEVVEGVEKGELIVERPPREITAD